MASEAKPKTAALQQVSPRDPSSLYVRMETPHPRDLPLDPASTVSHLEPNCQDSSLWEHTEATTQTTAPLLENVSSTQE